MYECEYFTLPELVDKRTYELWGSKAWMFFNVDALVSLDQIRYHFDAPVTVNNWSRGGPFQWRGLRTIFCDIGGNYSQHRLGNAFDLDVKGISAEEVRDEILMLQSLPEFALINCIEGDVNWFHFDCRNIEDRIRIVYP